MYSKDQIKTMVGEGIKTIGEFYQNQILNYTGRTTDTKEEYSEVIAEELLNLDIKNIIDGISEIIRDKGYHVKSHNGAVTTGVSKEDSNRSEERFAIDLFNESKNGKVFNRLGKIVDYQIPLKNKQDDKAGKIDLISNNLESIFLIEMKYGNNKETLLRCIFEIATYYQILSKQKFIESYKDEFGSLNEKNIKKAVLISNDSAQYDELKDLKNGKKNNLEKLMEALEVQIFVIDEDSLEVK